MRSLNTLDTTLGFVDTHRPDDGQTTIYDALDPCHAEALEAITANACDVIRTGGPMCACRDDEHEAMCPANPDPSVCDSCGETYDPDDLYPADNCPGGHCANPACVCWPCALSRRPARD